MADDADAAARAAKAARAKEKVGLLFPDYVLISTPSTCRWPSIEAMYAHDAPALARRECVP